MGTEPIGMRWIWYIFQTAILILCSTSISVAQISGFYADEGIAYYQSGDMEIAIEYLELALESEFFTEPVFVYLASAYLQNGDHGDAIKTAEMGLEKFPGHLKLKAIKAEAYIPSNYKKSISLYDDMIRTLENRGLNEQFGISREMIGRSLGLLYQRLASDEYVEGNLGRAADALFKARRLTSDNLTVHNNLTYILMEKGEWERAQETVDYGLGEFPADLNLLILKARILDETGNTEEALEVYRLLHLLDTSDINRAIAYGWALLNTGQVGKSNQFFYDMIDMHPQERKLYRTLIDINRQRFNLGGVSTVLEMKHGQFPDDIEIANELGRSFIASRQFERARSFYDTLASAHNSMTHALFSAHTFVYEEDYKNAVEAYRNLRTEWGDNPQLLAEFGMILEETGNLLSALEVYKKSLGLEQDGWTMIRIAELTEDEDERARMVQSANGTNYDGIARWIAFREGQRPADISEQREELLELLQDLFGLYIESQRTVGRIVEQDLQRLQPSVPELFHPKQRMDAYEGYIGSIFGFVLEKFPDTEAKALFGEMLEIYPDSPLISYHMGRMAFDQGQYQDAVFYFDKAVNKGADSPDLHFELGKTYRQKGDYVNSALSFERVLTLDDTHEEAYRELIRLSEEHEQLDDLCDRWARRYSNNRENEVLKQFLIEALHKADRFEEARKVASGS